PRRPPRATKAGGPYMDLSPLLSATTVQPGATIQLLASRAFTTSDPTGPWFAYSTWQDSALGWHDDGPTLSFTVSTSTPTPSATPVVNADSSQTVTLPSSAWLNGTVTGFFAGATVTTRWSKVSGLG